MNDEEHKQISSQVKQHLDDLFMNPKFEDRDKEYVCKKICDILGCVLPTIDDEPQSDIWQKRWDAVRNAVYARQLTTSEMMPKT